MEIKDAIIDILTTIASKRRERIIGMAQISQPTIDALNKAATDRDAANQSDAALATAHNATVAATSAESKAQSDSLAAHKTALDSATAALNAVKAELGVS